MTEYALYLDPSSVSGVVCREADPVDDSDPIAVERLRIRVALQELGVRHVDHESEDVGWVTVNEVLAILDGADGRSARWQEDNRSKESP